MRDAFAIARQTRRALKAFWDDSEAATAVEYGLLAALLGVIVSASVIGAGDSIASSWILLVDKLTTTFAPFHE